MRGQLQHRNQAASYDDVARLPPNPECTGQVKRLYTRRTKPQRWIVVGAYCSGCHAVAVGPEVDVQAPRVDSR